MTQHTPTSIPYEDLPLWKDDDPKYRLIRYLPQDDAVRPALLVVPGGGYSCVCMDTEGWPIADHFQALGLQVFILFYHTAPDLFPKPQRDILRAIRLIRQHATQWRVRPDQLAVVGFSAGGHLCACAATSWNDVDAAAGDPADLQSARPDAAILCYPVISLQGIGHVDSGKNLFGDDFAQVAEKYSMQNRVTPDTCPTFLWHTLGDQLVNYQNSILFLDALHAHGVPAELHLFPGGHHGMLLGTGRPDVSTWPAQARTFLQFTAGFQLP